jgi:hypothetical protein
MPYYPQLLQVRPQFTDEVGRVHECVLWYIGATESEWPLSDSQLETIQSAFDGSFISNIWGSYGASAANYVGAAVADWSSSSGLERPAGHSPESGGNGNELPAQVAILTSWHSPTRYKGGHGRTYLPCIGVEVQQDASHIMTGTASDLSGGWTELETTMVDIATTAGGGFTQVIFHQRPKVGAPFVSEIPSWTVNTLMATQRRRIRKVAHT